MGQIRREHQQPMLLRGEHTPGYSCIGIRDGHPMAEEGLRSLKLQFATGITGLSTHVEHRTELGIAMGMGFDRAPLPRHTTGQAF